MGSKLFIAPSPGCSTDVDCPDCGRRDWQRLERAWYKCNACLYYLTAEDPCMSDHMARLAQADAAKAELWRRATAPTSIPQLACPNCGGTLWHQFRDGGSHKCAGCKYWMQPGDPRLAEAYGRGTG